MDGSDNKSVSSTTKRRLSSSKGNDENDQSSQEIRDLNVQNPKKPTTKHFMSPTISAASKANPSRKKVLSERNESLDTHLQKTPTFDSKTTSSTEFREYEENALRDDVSSKPYDPLTNYLSPRPRFLRYKPNRHRDMFLRIENEDKQGKDETSSCRRGSLESKNDEDAEGASLADGNQEENMETEGEEIDQFEEVDEERCWGFRGVLKFLLLLVVLVLCTSYISTMNSPTPSPVVQAGSSLKNGYHMIQDHVNGIVKNLEFGSRNYHILVQNDARIDEDEMVDCEVMGEDEYDDELNEAGDEQNGESEALKIVEDEEKGTTEGLGEGVETEVKETAMVRAGEISGECLMNEVAMNPELQRTEDLIMSESPLINDGIDSQVMSSSIPDNFEKENEVANELVKQKVVGGEIGDVWKNTDDHDECYQIQSDEAEESLKEGIKRGKSGVVFSTMFSITAGLALAFHFKWSRNAQKDASPVVQPSFEPVVEEKCTSITASEADKNIEHLVPFTNSANSVEENFKVTYLSRGPIVDFLGEFEVREMSSPLRTCGMKNKMTESELSIHSVSVEKGIVSKAHSVPVHVKPAISEISTMDSSSPSYGRFTTEKKIVKKQREGVDREAKKEVVTTPVRRSSRIRNRSIISP